MKTYRLAMTALGASRGDTFSSDEEGWAKYVEAGVLIVVDEDAPEPEDVIDVVVIDDKVVVTEGDDGV